MKLLSGNKIFRAIGVMSGTSLDGLDIAAVKFRLTDGKWSFKLKEATTILYPDSWKDALKYTADLDDEVLTELDLKYGRYIGEQVLAFLQKTNFKPDLIASHGHTVFHQPEKSFTLQIGSGAQIADQTNILTVADFRSQNVALGGQGAPLVPIGDRLLFSEFEYCLNLGGFANISFEAHDRRIAFDICPVNIVLNALAEKHGRSFDKDGELGKQGKLIPELLERLNNLAFYHKAAPKSLGREWVDVQFMPEFKKVSYPEFDMIRTIYEHAAMQIANAASDEGKMLVTGGGAFNTFLIERMKEHSISTLVLPDKNIVAFKEAIIFAFLGVLRLMDIPNCLASVTGAERDHSSGIIFKP